MDIHTKFIVTCEKKEKSILDKLLSRTQEFEVWAPCVINGFRDRVNTDIYTILNISSTKEQIEVFGR